MERAALVVHVIICKMCRRYKAQLMFIRQFASRSTELIKDDHDADETYKLSESSRDKIKLAIRKEHQDGSNVR